MKTIPIVHKRAVAFKIPVDQTKPGTISERIVEHKMRLFASFSERAPEARRLLWLTLLEAEALAFETGLPELLFPELAREKAMTALGWSRRQQRLLAVHEVAFAE